MHFKFIHAADIHLDSPLLSLERYEGAPVEYVRGATRKAFQNLVDLALEEKVDFVLISGDLYDGDWRCHNTGLFFTFQAARLKEAGIKLFVIRGNHDAASQITLHLRLPDNVKEFSTMNPETAILEELGVAVHGQGFNTPAVSEDLSRNYPDPLKDYFNIGLLHTCATGREGHENYAPCDVNYLRNKGYDYWALGHVHKNEIIEENPWIIFPGNIQGRHIREEGAKGCTYVKVEGGRVETVEHRVLDVLRWSICQVEADGAETLDEILERADKAIDKKISESDGRLLALRFIITGACNAHSKLLNNPIHLNYNLRAVAAHRGMDSLWVEKVKIKTRPQVRAEDMLEGHPVFSLLKNIRELDGDKDFLPEIISELEREKNALPADLFNEGEMDPADGDYIRALLPEVEELILSRLFNREVLKDDS